MAVAQAAAIITALPRCEHRPGNGAQAAMVFDGTFPAARKPV